MNDMGCETYYFSLSLSLSLSLSISLILDYRFGGGTNQLEDGDTDNFRRLLELGMT